MGGKTLESRRPVTYRIWANMKQRCLNKNNADYINYGGRGISICEKWNTFDGFKEDMQQGFKNGLSLDRIDVNGNYCKKNCRWVTRRVQNNNTRRNRLVEYNGQTKTLSEWADTFNIKSSTLRQRFYVYKWSLNNCFLK